MRGQGKGRWAAWIAGAALAGIGLLAALSLGEAPSRGALAQTGAGGCPSPSPATTSTPSASAPFAVSIGGPCTGQTNIPITFTATVQNAGMSTSDLTYLWNFGDGSFGSGATVQHAYATASTTPYNVSVSVTGNGRSATANTTVTITQSLTISAGGPYKGGVGQAITFNASGTVPADTVFTWDFGDSTTATGKQVAHAYNTTGTFNVTLNASSATTGQVGVDKTTATIGVPSQGLSLTISGPTTATAGASVGYSVSATGSVPADVVYTWSWGDGTANTTGQSVTHTFAAAGSFTVTVTASSASTPAATGSATTMVTVAAPSPTPTPAPTGPSALYPAGWNIVAGGNGQTFASGNGPLYTFQAGDDNYEILPQGSPIVAGRGYWVFFNGPTNVPLVASTQSSITINAPAGQFIMVGNPSQTQTVNVRGADVVYIFDPSANNYAVSSVLPPGKGAWVFSDAGATITIGP
ncbi:MAG TPA: PKD domain-containing protein [Dehalococcoidia bacterium]|nr:PKD domain-containing protein [Dehalococcoidia bacterium]